ncbi:helix-turn-helix transcriptional regulator [Paenibacillus sp. strain BS8-2]
MTSPQSLKENTTLLNKQYPINVFRNAHARGLQPVMILGLHWHEHFELIYMTKGKANFHIDSVSYSVNEGDLLIVPPGGMHVGYQDGDEATEYIAVVFNPTLLLPREIDRSFELYLRPYLANEVQFPVYFAADDAAWRGIHHSLSAVITEFEEKQPAFEITTKANLTLMMVQLTRAHPLPEKEVRPYKQDRQLQRFKPLFQYIEEHYHEKLTIEMAASFLNLNPNHFCHIFKRTTGQTFIEYVNYMRMNEAQRLLKQTDSTITEISDRVGFGNVNYFTKIFKAFNGITPTHYRKS